MSDQPPADPNQPDPGASHAPPSDPGASSAPATAPGDGGQSPPGGQGEGGAPGAAAAAQPASPPADWRQARIDKLTGQLRETQRALAAEQQRNQAGQGQSPPAPGQQTPPPGAVDIERMANERAGQIAAQRVFDEACNAVAAEGAKANPDFQARINSLRGLVNPQDANEAASYSALLAAAIDNGPTEAARILHHLGGDLTEAQRILSLPPMKIAVEITKLAMTAPEKLSSVSKPITPVAGGRQGPHTQVDPSDPERSDNLSTAEWMRRRNEQTTRKSA